MVDTIGLSTSAAQYISKNQNRQLQYVNFTLSVSIRTILKHNF